jgi:hypothetical protein
MAVGFKQYDAGSHYYGSISNKTALEGKVYLTFKRYEKSFNVRAKDISMIEQGRKAFLRNLEGRLHVPLWSERSKIEINIKYLKKI